MFRFDAHWLPGSWSKLRNTVDQGCLCLLLGLGERCVGGDPTTIPPRHIVVSNSDICTPTLHSPLLPMLMINVKMEGCSQRFSKKLLGVSSPNLFSVNKISHLSPIPHICHPYHPWHRCRKKLWRIFRFQINTWQMWRNLKFPHIFISDSSGTLLRFLCMTYVEESYILPNLEVLRITPPDRCGEIWNLPCFLLQNLFCGDLRRSWILDNWTPVLHCL